MLPENSPLTAEQAYHWAAAASPDPAKCKKALIYWLDHRNELPGPVCFDWSPLTQNDPDWTRILQHSAARCDCGVRRWITPLRDVEFIPPSESELYTLGPGRPEVAIGPWCGSTQSAYVQLSVGNGFFVRHFAPYSHVPTADVLAPGTGIREHYKLLMVIAQELAQAKQAGGAFLPVGFYIAIDDDVNPPFSLMPFAVYDVTPAQNMVVIGVSQNCVVVNPADRSNIHECSM